MKESIDTLKLRLIDYEVSDNANLMVQPALFNYGTGETEKETININGKIIEGAKAYCNRSNFNLTINNNGAFVQMSVPKVYNKSNDKPVNAKECKDVLQTVEKELFDNGINTNLLNSDLSRVDVFKQELLRYTFDEYSRVFAVLNGTRMKKRDYGTTYLYHNNDRELSFYDKVVEQKIRNGEKEPPHSNNVRCEVRLLKKRVIKKTDLQTAKDLVNNYDVLSEIYRGGVSGVFKGADIRTDQQTEMFFLGQNEVEKELLYIRELNGKLTLKEIKQFFNYRGVDWTLKNMDFESFIATALRISEAKNKRDLKSKMAGIFKEYTLGKYALPNRTKQLYDELYLKFAV